MDVTLFSKFRQIAYSKAGIALKDGKETLVAARVAKRVRALGLQSERDYLSFLESDQSGEELVHFLDAISTNYTSFFREPDHFRFLDEQLRERLAAGQRRFRIWCAASSSGEEPYSIAVTALDALAGQPVDLRILATDISTHVLQAAADGIYSTDRLEPVPPALRRRYFIPCGPDRHSAAPALREVLTFKRLNLITPRLPMNGPLDVVFCRNVMMYFDRKVRQHLVGEVERLLSPGGYLITGHSETLTGLDTALVACRPSIHLRPADPDHAAATSAPPTHARRSLP